MRILHVLASDRFSGAENVVCQIISLLKNDANIEMAYTSTDGPIREALTERGINFLPMSKLCKNELARIIKEYSPEMIHAHDMRASYIASLVAKGIPIICHIHNNAFASRGLTVKSIAFIFAARKAKHIFWVSDSAYNGYFFKQFFKRKSSVLPNIIDIDALYDKMQKDTKTYDYDVVYLGRLSYPKNPQRMISVLSKVLKEIPNARFAVVGSGELEEETKKAAVDCGVYHNIDFLGFMSNPLKIVHDSKVMIMTSRWEGTPMSALESMALGTPIITTPTDGLINLIDNNVNGFASDDDDVLKDKIITLMNDIEKRMQFSENAIRKARILNDKRSYLNCLLEQYKCRR